MANTPAKQTQTLPYTTIQPDFLAVLGDVREGVVAREDFWVSAYHCTQSGESKSVHGKIGVTKDGMEGRDGVEWLGKVDGGTTTYDVRVPAIGLERATLRVPRTSIPHPNASPITAFDIHQPSSESPTRIASAHADGRVYIHTHSTSSSSASNTKSQVQSFSLGKDVTAEVVRWFPSGSVLLVATNTYEVRVVSVPRDGEEGAPALGTTPRILKGHRRTPTELSIIGTGRTVLSASKDGSLRLWEVGSGTQNALATSTGSVPVNAIATVPNPDNNDEVKVWAALGNGSLELLSLPATADAAPVNVQAHTSAVHALALSSDGTYLVSGTVDGSLALWDVSTLSTVSGKEPLARWTRTRSAIENLAFLPSSSTDVVQLVVATEDGLPYVARIHLPDGRVEVVTELVGGEVDPVRGVRVGSDGAIWAGGDDGVLRRY